MKKTLEKIELALEKFVASKYQNGSLSLQAIASSAMFTSDNFTRSRKDFQTDYLNDRSVRAAYLAHFTLTNAAKAHHCLMQIFNFLQGYPAFRILDLGSGPAPSSLTSALLLQGHEIEVTAVDQNENILDDAQFLFKKIRPDGKFHKICGHISSNNLKGLIGNAKYDIVFVSNFLNELSKSGEAHRIVMNILENHLDDNGYLIVIDPALKETSRLLMALRDFVIAHSEVCLISPCLHRQNCPMLCANDRDWCHFYIEWERPSLIEKMDALVGTDHRFLKLSYLIFQIKKTVPSFQGLHRVVSSSLKSKGKTEAVLCGFDGVLRKVRRLDKDASEHNSDIDSVKRGDVVEYQGDERIAAEDVFKITAKWNINSNCNYI